MRASNMDPKEITESEPYQLGVTASELKLSIKSQPYAANDNRKWVWLAGFNDN